MAEKKIGANTYKTEPLPARDALKLWYRITKAFGPAIERMPEILRGVAAGRGDPKKNIAGDPAAMMAANTKAVEALVDIMNHLDEDGMISLIESILKAGMIKRSAWDTIDLDLDFRENLGEVFPVILWIMQEQFSDLFNGLRASGRAVTG